MIGGGKQQERIEAQKQGCKQCGARATSTQHAAARAIAIGFRVEGLGFRVARSKQLRAKTTGTARNNDKA